jgi:hypothetical protein
MRLDAVGRRRIDDGEGASPIRTLVARVAVKTWRWCW